MITVYVGHKVFVFKTGLFVINETTGYKIYEKRIPETDKGEGWLGTVPIGSVLISGLAPVDMPEQNGLFS